MTTVPFLPTRGGTQTVVALLAREFVELGCEVKVATHTPSEQQDSFSYEVIRQPGINALLRLYRWADAVVQHGPSLRFGWPIFFQRRPSLIVHHIWMNESSPLPAVTKALRLLLLKRCRNLAVSDAVGRSLRVLSDTVPNPYDTMVFHLRPDVPRVRDLLFAGRLIPEKGVDVLLDALALLAQQQKFPSVTIAGAGPELANLTWHAEKLGLAHQVEFIEEYVGERLARVMNAHRILVVPSRWPEPFGVVALEGIACGCTVIGCDGGGLPEAIGPCGATFANGDAGALASTIRILLARPDMLKQYQANARAHLAGHQPRAVAERYLQFLAAVT